MFFPESVKSLTPLKELKIELKRNEGIITKFKKGVLFALMILGNLILKLKASVICFNTGFNRFNISLLRRARIPTVGVASSILDHPV